MDEEILDNLQAIEDEDETSNFPLFQQKQVQEFIKSIVGENFSAQKLFQNKFNRCLSLFALYLSHMITVMKEDNKKKKNQKIKQQVTKNDIIAVLKMIDLHDIAQELEDFQRIQPISQTSNKKETNQQEENQEEDDVREIQNFENQENQVNQFNQNENNNYKIEQNELIQDDPDELDEEIKQGIDILDKDA